MADDKTGNERIEYRKKRVKRIKKIIVALCIIFVILPTILTVFLIIKVSSMQRFIDELTAGTVETGAEPGTAQARVKDSEITVSGGAAEGVIVSGSAVVSGGAIVSGSAAISGGAVASEAAIEPVSKKVYLTFDDGPGVYTEKILDILKKQGVRAAFFVTGKEDAYSKSMYQRIVEEGHTLGMHSYSHRYDEIYKSKKTFEEDLDKLYSLLYDTTGVRPKWYRFPGGSATGMMKTPLGDLVGVLEKKDISYIDWNVITPEAMDPGISKKNLISGIMSDVENYDTAVVLLYDAADRAMSVKALSPLIKKMKENKYELLPLEDNTIPIRHNELN